MAWSGFADPRNYPTPGWADGLSFVNTPDLDGANLTNYQPGEWADGSDMAGAFAGTAHPVIDEHGEQLVVYSLGVQHSRQFDEAATAVDTLETLQVYPRRFDETATAVDALDKLQAHFRRSEETVTAADEVSQLDVSSRAMNETVTAVDTLSAVPGREHRSDETVTTADSLRAERITFWRHHHEDVTAVVAVDRLALLTGHTVQPSPGWEVREVKKTLHQDLEPGQSLSYIVEDYFEYRTLCDGMLWLQNTEAKNVHARVTENVQIDGRIDSFILFEGTLVGKSIEPIRLPQPLTLPSRVVFHEVTLTNNETEHDAYVITLIGGWVGHSTYLPAELPIVYGEGLQ
jgi:hypothetical protein